MTRFAAAALRALTLHLEQLGVAEPTARTVTTTFEKPTEIGVIEGRCVIHHHGKRVISGEVLLMQDDVVRTRVHILFGAARPSELSVAAPVSAPCIDINAVQALPYIEGVTPSFTRYIDFRWAEGPFPFAGDSASAFKSVGRWRERGEQALEETLAILDAWPAAVLCLANRPIPASTVTWTAHLYPRPDDMDPDAFFWLEASTLSAQDGYATAVARLHDSKGRLIAWGEQLVAYFD